MNPMTAENLRSAFGGESQAHMRYLIWGDKAKRDGFPNVANLFKAISYAEQVHATGHFNALRDEDGDFSVTSMAGFGLGTTSENLQGAINGELFEIKQMYPSYIAVAEMQEEKSALRPMNFALAAEKIHAKLFQEAKDLVDKNKDIDIEKVYICPVCGYTAADEAEDICPICGVSKDKFKVFD